MKLYDKDDGLIYEIDFIKPNIVIFKAYYYMSGTFFDLIQSLHETLEENIPLHGGYHIIKSYSENFFDNYVITPSDYAETQNLYLEIQKKWVRLLNIDVTNKESLALQIIRENSKQFFNKETQTHTVRTLDEAMTLIKNYKK